MNRKGEKVVTTDRTVGLWGARTPYGQDEAWPVRVDQFLEEGVAEEEIDA